MGETSFVPALSLVYVINISVYFMRNAVYSSNIILQARFGATASSSLSTDLRDSISWVFLHLSVTAASFLTFTHLYVTFCYNYSLFSNIFSPLISPISLLPRYSHFKYSLFSNLSSVLFLSIFLLNLLA